MYIANEQGKKLSRIIIYTVCVFREEVNIILISLIKKFFLLLFWFKVIKFRGGPLPVDRVQDFLCKPLLLKRRNKNGSCIIYANSFFVAEKFS